MIREAVLRDFPTWENEKQIKEFQAYKALGDYSPFNEDDYKLMEMVMNNPNAEVECEDGVCTINNETSTETVEEETVVESEEISEETPLVENEEVEDEPIIESPESDALAKKLDRSIIEVDENLGVEDFALAVAKVLKDEYGRHNFKTFLTTLKKEL